MSGRRRVGYACSYTPLPLIHAAGFTPFRVLPVGGSPDQAGSLLHDNLCPHVKRVLDRAMAGDLPETAGMVFVNSCDAMRRLADAWRSARPGDRVTLLDLPPTVDEASAAFFAGELARLRAALAEWAGTPVTDRQVLRSIGRYNQLASSLSRLAARATRGALTGGWPRLQELVNRAVTEPVDDTHQLLSAVEGEPDEAGQISSSVPVYLFGNVLPDPAALEMITRCGAEPVADELCTGARQLTPLAIEGEEDVLEQMAGQLLARPRCARTFDAAAPGALAEELVSRVASSGARGVLVHVMKFCDPYLVRLPAVRNALRRAGVPTLVLEGDCSLRSLGQQRTRIEAFVEMLGGNPS